MTTKTEQATRDGLQQAHDELIGEGKTGTVDDPTREWDGPIRVALDKTRVFLDGQVLQHLPKSAHDQFLQALKKQL